MRYVVAKTNNKTPVKSILYGKQAQQKQTN